MIPVKLKVVRLKEIIKNIKGGAESMPFPWRSCAKCGAWTYLGTYFFKESLRRYTMRPVIAFKSKEHI